LTLSPVRKKISLPKFFNISDLEAFFIKGAKA
jgi:hypothetical protein